MISVKFINFYTIEVMGLNSPIASFSVKCNNENIKIRQISNYENRLYIDLDEEIILGNHYQLELDGLIYEINMTDLVDDPSFDIKFNYQGNDLGATCHDEYVIFKIFAPLAYAINVIIDYDNTQKTFPLKRIDNGVFYGKFYGFFDKKSYLYEIHQNGEKIVTLDPYSIACTLNKGKSVIIDKTKFKTKKVELEKMHSYTDAIIYETSVRDFTSYPKSEINYKGTYYGFVEKNRKYKGQAVGIDLLKKLGVTHVQLLPVNAFIGVNEMKIKSEYNWGYNPYLYFALEGSLSLNPSSPITRINEFKNLVKVCHENNIRVNLDVVFNHIYKYEDSVLQKIVPNYYFRHNKEGLSNGSYCGNDLDTKRPMVRHLIINCLKFFVDFYDIDGFRFDLLGIIDIETSKIIDEELRKIKSDIMLYGEGWNMPTFLPDNEKSMLDNARLLPHFAFFNDFFRDTLKGSSYSLNDDRGYLLGNGYRYEDFINSFKGKYRDIYKFVSPLQSINYVECHDNATLYDKISIVFGKKNQKEILKALKLCNAINVLACGVPFIHMGQEVGLSKRYLTNTYNTNDLDNQYNFEILINRKEQFNYMCDVITLRKKYNVFRLNDYQKIDEIIHFERIGDLGLRIIYKLENNKKLSLLINTNSKENLYFTFNKTHKVIFNEVGLVHLPVLVDSIIVAPLNMVVVVND